MEATIKDAHMETERSEMEKELLISYESGNELDQVLKELRTVIKVIGVGGAGCNTISRMFKERIRGIELTAMNTDAQHLLHTIAHHKLLIGRNVTKGLGAGSLPPVGMEAAEESEEEIKNALKGADMVFLTCGLGGGTGSGAIPIIAKAATELDILTVCVVTLPFNAEGKIRMENAQYGLEQVADVANTVIVIPNEKLLDIAPQLPLDAAFRMADDTLMRAVKGIAELITEPGMINLDFADLQTIMKEGGLSMIGMGEADSGDRAVEAVRNALSSPLLDIDIANACGALVNVVGGKEMSLADGQRAVQEIYQRIDKKARIVWGASVDPELHNRMRALVVLTGVRSEQIIGAPPMIGWRRYGIESV